MSTPPSLGRKIGGILLIGGALGISAANGLLTSPLYDPIAFLIRPFVGPWLASGPLQPYTVMGFLTGFTWLVAGVPAAIFERVSRGHQSPMLALAIWLAAAIALAMPGLLGLSGYFAIE